MLPELLPPTQPPSGAEKLRDDTSNPGEGEVIFLSSPKRQEPDPKNPKPKTQNPKDIASLVKP